MQNHHGYGGDTEIDMSTIQKPQHHLKRSIVDRRTVFRNQLFSDLAFAQQQFHRGTKIDKQQQPQGSLAKTFAQLREKGLTLRSWRIERFGVNKLRYREQRNGQGADQDFLKAG